MLKIVAVAVFCVASQAAVALEVQDTPAAAGGARERVVPAKTEGVPAEREGKEAQEAQELARTEQAEAAKRRRCHKLRLEAKSANEHVARAAARGNRSPEETRLWARRQAETLAAECPA
jgi:hypothetical protein